MGTVVNKEQCPKCAEAGGDKARNNLVNYADGSAHCFACGYNLLGDTTQFTHSTVLKNAMTFTIDNARDFPKDLKSRAIKQETLVRYGVKVGYDNDTGKFLQHVIFPYVHSETLKPIAAKLRSLTEKKFWAVGDFKNSTVFGLNVNTDAKQLIICEAEIDALSIAQERKDIAVWATSGASAVGKLKQLMHKLRKFEVVTLWFDNDEAGQKATAEALALLPKGNVRVVQPVDGFKDANELLVAGRGTDIRKAIHEAKRITPTGIADNSKIMAEVFSWLDRDRTNNGIQYSTGIRELDLASGGFTPGTLWTVAARTGCGKSLFMEHLAIALAKQQIHTFYIPLEMTQAECVKRMLQSYTGLPICSDVLFEPTPLQKEQLKQATVDVLQFMHWYDYDIRLTGDVLESVIQYAVDSYDCKVVFLDHITAACTAVEKGLDWSHIDKFMSVIKSIAQRLNVCIVCVTHVSRDGDKEDSMPKLDSIRGSAGIGQYSDFVISMARKMSETVTTFETTKLNRHVGKYATWQMKFISGRLVEVNDTAEFDNAHTGNTKQVAGQNTTQQLRTDDSNTEQSETGTVRSVAHTVPDDKPLQTRLAATNGLCNNRTKRLHVESGQTEDTGGSESPKAKPHNAGGINPKTGQPFFKLAALATGRATVHDFSEQSTNTEQKE